MKYLVDTNIFLEILLNQDRKDDCKVFLEENIKQLYISDFSLHSIGVILFRNKKEKIFNMFVTDIMQNIEILSLTKFKYSYLVLAGKLPFFVTLIRKRQRQGF